MARRRLPGGVVVDCRIGLGVEFTVMGTDHADTDPGYDGYICGNDVRIPLGIWAAMSDRIYRIIMPILDFMQTMPAFVYLIPAIPFFGLGPVSGIFATVIFSMPPAIRLTTLGIRQVPAELTEAADAFGSTPRQKLLKVQLPLATPTIMTGINQTIMLALSMVVIAAMIGAGGLGAEVWKAIQRLEPGAGFEAGIAVVILAMILDRITQNIGQRRKIEKKGITQC